AGPGQLRAKAQDPRSRADPTALPAGGDDQGPGGTAGPLPRRHLQSAQSHPGSAAGLRTTHLADRRLSINPFYPLFLRESPMKLSDRPLIPRRAFTPPAATGDDSCLFVIRRFLLNVRPLALVVWVALSAAGCGQEAKLVPVTGHVTLDGAALSAGSVLFVPDETKGNNSQVSPRGMIDSQGNYELFSDGKKGAPAGWYKVVVSLTSPGIAPPPKGPTMDFKFQHPERTDLAIEVVPQPQPGAYDLKLTK